ARMLEAIDAAREYVLLEMYLVESSRIASRFVEAMRAARARGARVCVMFDAFGSLHFRRSDRRRLTEVGVELRFFHPLHLRKGLRTLLRDHRRLPRTAGPPAFGGGGGLRDEFTAAAAGGPWRDLMVQIRGPVVRDWQRAFARTWRRSGPPLDLPEPSCAPN